MLYVFTHDFQNGNGKRWLISDTLDGEGGYAMSSDVQDTPRPHYAGLEQEWSVGVLDQHFSVDPALVVTPQFW